MLVILDNSKWNETNTITPAERKYARDLVCVQRISNEWTESIYETRAQSV